MSIVNYGDTFYLYGFTTSNMGWIVPSTDNPPDDGPYYVMCQNCGNNSPFPLATYTIIPGVPNPNSSNSIFINSSGNNVQGQPITTDSSFFIADSSLLTNQTNWPSQQIYMSVTASYGDIHKSSISNNPNTAILQSSNISNPGGTNNANYVYGVTTFNLNLSFYNSGSKCGNVFVKASVFGYDGKHITQSQTKIAPIFNSGCNTPLPIINFIFVPVNGTQCVNNACVPIDYATFTNNNVGTALFNSSTQCDCNIIPVRYSCSGPEGTCVQSANGAYPTSSCGGVCSYVRYSCRNGLCVQDQNGKFGSDTCGGTCNPANPIWKKWWFWLIIVGVIIFVLVVLGAAIYEFSKPRTHLIYTQVQ